MKKSKVLIASAILGALYAIYLVVYFGSGSLGADNTAEAVGVGIATILVLPHMVTAVVAAIFSIVAVITYKQWAAITAFILYFVASALFPLYALFTIPIGILALFGWLKLKKIVAVNVENIIEQ